MPWRVPKLEWYESIQRIMRAFSSACNLLMDIRNLGRKKFNPFHAVGVPSRVKSSIAGGQYNHACRQIRLYISTLLSISCACVVDDIMIHSL